MSHCPQCGEPTPEGARACPFCGAPLAVAVPQRAPASRTIVGVSARAVAAGAIAKAAAGLPAIPAPGPLPAPSAGAPSKVNRTIVAVGITLEERKRQAHRVAKAEVRQRDPLGLGYRGEPRDLRHPRSRVRISTPKGDLPIVLWERERDWRPHGAHPDSACVVVPNACVPIYLCADPCSRRHHLRAAVRQALMPLLAVEDVTGSSEAPAPADHANDESPVDHGGGNGGE